jgi:uncharacterized protein (TIGR02757 family)
MAMPKHKLKEYLDAQVLLYNSPNFIAHDPIAVPHEYSLLQDVEIAAFMAATLAWGNRTSILNSARKLMKMMDNKPFQFITQHQESDLLPFLQFKHRTFLPDDTLYFITFLQWHYTHYNSLEQAFVTPQMMKDNNITVELALNHFYNYFFSLPHLPRTHKHVPSPQKGSACKRLNMLLRWMVRKDAKGVDFGIWQFLQAHQLIMPMDVHVCKVAHQLGIIAQPKSNWATAVELTNNLKQWQPHDPVIYDYALFSIGVHQKL